MSLTCVRVPSVWLVATTAVVLACGSSSDDLFASGASGARADLSSGGRGGSGGTSSAGEASAGPVSFGGGSLAGGSAGASGKGGGGASGKAGGGTSGKAGTLSSGGIAAGGGAPSRGGAAAQAGKGSGGAPIASGDAGGTADAGAGGEGGDGCIGAGASCRRPVSCAELHRVSPDLPSGRYALQPSGSALEFFAYCEMSAEGGGWTLTFNMGTTFDRTVTGVAGALCYDMSCTNLAYSRVLLEADIMLDMSDTSISGASYAARAIVTGVDAALRSRTVRALLNSGPNYIENDDNSNLVLRLSGTDSCLDQLPYDMATALCSDCANGQACSSPVLVFGDSDSGCAEAGAMAFAIGAANSRTEAWSNCAGWPQAANLGDVNYYPDYFRVWVR